MSFSVISIVFTMSMASLGIVSWLHSMLSAGSNTVVVALRIGIALLKDHTDMSLLLYPDSSTFGLWSSLSFLSFLSQFSSILDLHHASCKAWQNSSELGRGNSCSLQMTQIRRRWMTLKLSVLLLCFDVLSLSTGVLWFSPLPLSTFVICSLSERALCKASLIVSACRWLPQSSL